MKCFGSFKHCLNVILYTFFCKFIEIVVVRAHAVVCGQRWASDWLCHDGASQLRLICVTLSKVWHLVSRHKMTRFFANYSDYVPSSAVAAGLIAFAAGFVAHKISNQRSHTSHANATNVRSTTASGSVVYESSRAVDEYLLFHYLPAKQLCPYELAPHSALDFPKRCADLCATHVPKGKHTTPPKL
jgi:hypothetical protein